VTAQALRSPGAWRRHRRNRRARRVGAAPAVTRGASSPLFEKGRRGDPRSRDVAAHPLRVGPRVLAQRPADRLPEEELPGVERRLDAGVEEVDVGPLPRPELAEDRRAPLPEVAAPGPREHLPAHRPRFLAEELAEEVGSDRVDDVPPGPRDDHLLPDRQGVEVPERRGPLPPRQLDGGVHLLAVRRPPEDAEDLSAERGRVGEVEPGEELTARRPQGNRPDAVERHRRLHVGLRPRARAGSPRAASSRRRARRRRVGRGIGPFCSGAREAGSVLVVPGRQGTGGLPSCGPALPAPVRSPLTFPGPGTTVSVL